MKLLMIKMMMRWEPVCHKTKWQQHCILRNCSSALSIYSSARISDSQPCGGGGRIQMVYIQPAQLGLSPPNRTPPWLQCFQKDWVFLYNYFVLLKIIKPFFLFQRYISLCCMENNCIRKQQVVSWAYLQSKTISSWALAQYTKCSLIIV